MGAGVDGSTSSSPPFTSEAVDDEEEDDSRDIDDRRRGLCLEADSDLRGLGATAAAGIGSGSSGVNVESAVPASEPALLLESATGSATASAGSASVGDECSCSI